MSGRKETYVSIPEREARRLREQDAKFRVLQNDLPERLADIRSATLNEVRRESERVNRRLDEFQETADRLHSDIADLERDSQRRLRAGLEAARADYTNLINRERADRLESEAEMRRDYTRLVAEERAERQQQISELQSRVSNIENREERLQQMAQDWLQDLRILQESIDKLPHQRFAPGSMERIDGHIRQAEINLRNGASQASLSRAQDSYFQLIELRTEVLFKEQEFEVAYLRALESVRALVEEVQQNRRATIPAEDADQQDIEVDIDFWSRGNLSTLQNRLKEIETVLEQQRATLRLAQVARLEEEAVALRPRLVDTVEMARLSIINSQACYNVAEAIAEVMEEQGYSVEQGTYEGEDQRAAYAIKMRNRGGDEFVSIVTPSAEQELAYSTEMNFYDRNQDETMRQRFAHAVYEGLNRRGLQASPPRETVGMQEDNEQARDLERFQQRKPLQREQRANRR